MVWIRIPIGGHAKLDFIQNGSLALQRGLNTDTI